MAYQEATARYGQACPACGAWIDPGEQIGADDADGLGWRHAGCLRRRRPPPPYPESLARTWDRGRDGGRS